MNRELFERVLVINTPVHEAITNEAKNIHDVFANHQYVELNKPYSVHLDYVAEFFTRYGYLSLQKPEDVSAVFFAAYLHDSIEDARQTYSEVNEIAKRLGVENYTLAADIVYALTDEKGRTRRERENDRYFKGIRTTKYAALLKCCDRAANISFAWECGNKKKFEMYRDEMDHFIESITTLDEDDPKDIEYLAPRELISLLVTLKSLGERQ